MEIRRLIIDDYEEIIKLWWRAGLPFKAKGRDSKEAMAAQAGTSSNFFLGAYKDDRLVGVAVITCDGRKGWINRLAVDPDYRRRSIAQALIAESEKVLRKHGISLFCALIDEGNAASKELFKKCGYVEHHDVVYFSKRPSEDV
jgi:ribosomal protein S18 acetylase RimI-like enzyme